MEPRNLIRIIADTLALEDIRLNTADESEFRTKLSRFGEQWTAVQTQLMVIAKEPLRALKEVQSELNKRLNTLQLSAFQLRQLATTAIAPIKNDLIRAASSEAAGKTKTSPSKVVIKWQKQHKTLQALINELEMMNG